MLCGTFKCYMLIKLTKIDQFALQKKTDKRTDKQKSLATSTPLFILIQNIYEMNLIGFQMTPKVCRKYTISIIKDNYRCNLRYENLETMWFMQHLIDACYAGIAHEAQSTSHAADRETLSQELENAKKIDEHADRCNKQKRCFKENCLNK